MPKVKLLCFPYAGGSSVVFKKWKQHLHPDIELHPVELSGRGKRAAQPLYENLDELVDDMFTLLENIIQQGSYAIFGHSLGSVISYELVQAIRAANLPMPLHIFFSGGSAPHVGRPGKKKYQSMSDEEIKNSVAELGGTPPEFFEHPDLLQFFLPLLKSDFKIAETDRSNRPLNPLNIPITVFLGKEEDLTAEQCDGWKKHTTGCCRIFYFNGGHFFLNQQTDELLQIINTTLLPTNLKAYAL